MSNLIEHAKREFLAAGYKPVGEEEDGPNKWIQENILELLSVFSKQGHSGFSVPYCIDVFTKLAKFEPLCPLTGSDDEWSEVEMACGRTNDVAVYSKDLMGKPMTLMARFLESLMDAVTLTRIAACM